MKVVNIDAETGKRVYSRKEVAKMLGKSIQIIRIWEDRGLIPVSTRDENGYRWWYEDDIENIRAYAEMPRKEKLK